MSSAERVLPVLLALCLAASALFVLIPGADAAESDYDEDLGAFYGYELRLIYSGSGATSVTWDFGDGSETAEGLNVTHRYEETGVYIVTQTAANEKGSSVAKYRVEIMGYPQIIYDLGYDGRTLTINQSGWNIAPELPDDPVRPGYRFDGWYTDTALTEPLDLEAGVDLPLTVYAKWTATGGSGDIGGGDEDQGGSGGEEPAPEPEGKDTLLFLIIGFIGAAALAAGAYMRRPVIIVAGLVLVAAAVLLFTGVVEWPL